MKKFSLKSLLSATTLVLAVLVLGGIGSKTFAYDSAYYTGNFTPTGCTPASMNVVNLSGGTFSGGNLSANTIYVFEAGNYTISGNITLNGNCVSMITNGDTAGNVVLDFANGGYITSNGFSNLMVAGFDATHMIESDLLWSRYQGIYLRNGSNAVIRNVSIKNTVTNGAGIAIENFSGSTISNNILSGHRSLGLVLYNSSNITISNNTLTNNNIGISLQNNSTNNTLSSNTVTYNTDKGIWLQAGSNGNTLSSNTINNNTNYGMLLEGVSGSAVSSNTITNQTFGIGLSLSSNTNQNNTVSNNTISANVIGVYVDAAKSNIFTSNNISSNSNWGLQLVNAATGNTFTSDTISSNTNVNIDISNAHNNQFINTTVQSSSVGINLTNANYNTFSGVNVASNTNGTVLTTSSYNTLKLVNNTNGIGLYGGSNSNNITNTQVVGQNSITLSNGSNNVITGGLFAAASTTSTSVNIALKNNQGSPTYDVTGAGLSGTYAGLMTGTTLSLPITLTAGDGVKNILVTYNNGNKQYDAITFSAYTPPPGGNGGGGGGGGGIPTCISSQLVCTSGARAAITGGSCQGGNLGHSCTIGGTGTLPVGNIIGSPYSTELNNAYLWAYAYGITTMNTIQKANMGGTLIRAHMAKMISNFAITLGGFTPDTIKQCTFDDVANQSAEMRFYIRISCQLGLMGINMTSFDPNGEVTRAQFGTILSRLIRGSIYNDGIPYYTSHLNALKLAGIMTQISNPNMKELRGYVMLMMKRTYEGGFIGN